MGKYVGSGVHIMGKGIEKLTTLEVKKASAAGYYGDGGGLWLQVSSSGSKSWVFRFTSPQTGKTREMGLGSFRTFTLAEARSKARECRQIVADGHDPITQRQEERDQNKIDTVFTKTFAACAEAYIESHQSGWKNSKHAAQWKSTIAKYAEPVIGTLAVSKVDTNLILRILEPIWTAKNETASRIRGRLESILDWATVRGYRSGDNPARWKGHLDTLLAAPSRVQKVTHHAALPYQNIGELMQELRKNSGIAALALQFLIFTACRSGEVRGATWAEIDLQNRVWTIPATRMKAGKEHRVPLSKAAVSVLAKVRKSDDCDLIFTSSRCGMLSDMTLTAVLRRMQKNDITVHGFRSTFRDWAGETSAYPREVIEHALAHQLKDKAEAAYARGTLFSKRQNLMESWANYCNTPSAELGKVIGIHS